MKSMKTLLAGLLAAAAVAPASAAIVNVAWTWNGADTGIASGVIQVNYVTDGVAVTSGTLLSFTAEQASTGTALYSPGSPTLNNFSFTFSGGGTSAVQTGGSSFSITGFDSPPALAPWGFSGTQGGAWTLFNDDNLLDNAGDNSLTVTGITPVPEPELLGAVAGAGLVAFGMIRRRAGKA